MRRSARLFAIAEVLRGRRTGVTAEDLAERFGVSVRTLYRDLDALRDADLPVLAERGRGGGYALDRGYSLPPVNFTAAEAAMLLVVTNAMLSLRMVPFEEKLRSAMDKVRAALPTAAQRELDRRLSTLSFVGVPAHTAPAEVRAVLERAWFENRPVRIGYEGRFGLTERRVRIASVVMERTETRLNTDDLDLGEARQFLLHRVVSAALIDEPPPA